MRQTQKSKLDLFNGECEAGNDDSGKEDEEEGDPEDGGPCEGHRNAAAPRLALLDVVPGSSGFVASSSSFL